jgi:hypothetical protein
MNNKGKSKKWKEGIEAGGLGIVKENRALSLLSSFSCSLS